MPNDFVSRKAAIWCATDPFFLNLDEQERACLVSRLSDLPAADVVQVVRCKDCKHRYTTACLMEFTVNGKSIEWSADNRSCNIGTPKDGGENHAE